MRTHTRPILHATNAVRSAQSGVFGEEASSTLDIGEKKFEQKGWERERNDAWDRDWNIAGVKGECPWWNDQHRVRGGSWWQVVWRGLVTCTCLIYCLLHPSCVVVVGLFLWEDGLDVFAVELQGYSSSMCLFGAALSWCGMASPNHVAFWCLRILCSNQRQAIDLIE